MPNTITVIFSLVGVITVIVAMFWFAGWFQKKYGFGFGSSSKSMKIEDTLALSPDSRLIVANIDGVRYLVGVGNVRLLSELGEAALDEESLQDKKGMPITEAFKTVLSQKLNIQNKPKVEEKEDAGENRFNRN